MQSTLDQVVERLNDAMSEVRQTDADDLLGDLYEIERHLRSANRRLQRALGSLEAEL